MRENSLIVAINSGYVHSSLAVRLLARESGVPFAEYNINMNKRDVLPRLSGRSILFFSCYIWNSTYVFDLVADLKAMDNNCIIVLGGPSVSFEGVDIMKANKAIDYIITGEGEDVICQFFDAIEARECPSFKGVLYRNGEDIKGDTTYLLASRLKCLPYDGDIVYFESSRGCPFACSYCLSGYLGGVRYYDMEDVKASLTKLAQMNIRVVKFVDRTFNVNLKRSKEILRHLLTLECNTMWHFEIGGDLLDDETIDLLNSGHFQVEIGIQSFNEKTLSAVHRSCNLDVLETNIRRLKIHKHVDLIAGLPFEDLSSFIRSFDRAYFLKAHMLQLGFLKVLPGSELREEKRIIYSKEPPYTVLSTDWLSSKDIFELERVEKALDAYTAKGRFVHSLKLLYEYHPSPYQLFLRLADALGDDIYSPIGYTKAMENMFYAFKDEEYISTLVSLMHCDYNLSGAKGKMPKCLPEISYIARDVRKSTGIEKDRRFFVTNIDYNSRKFGLFAVLTDTGHIIKIQEDL